MHELSRLFKVCDARVFNQLVAVSADVVVRFFRPSRGKARRLGMAKLVVLKYYKHQISAAKVLQNLSCLR